MKTEYANYLGEENHLVAISARHNRSKGARGPEEWAPPDNALWCDYASNWAEIKAKWGLTMTAAEAVAEMLTTCEDPLHVWIETVDHLVLQRHFSQNVGQRFLTSLQIAAEGDP